MATSTLDVDQLSLEYFDQFFFAGASIDAKPGDLLVGLNGMLHDDAVSGRTLFHLHRGWYEKGDEGDILVNQNFDASDEMPMGETKTPKRVVRILTKVDLRAGMYPVDEGRIMERLDLLHDLSKDYFKKAVQPAILQSVGIVDKN